ncbi:MAG TPA: hypothetical protein GX513_06060 [Firmicutes bacterium]|nr:hypothetical protein [Bacillota bacterium]
MQDRVEKAEKLHQEITEKKRRLDEQLARLVDGKQELLRQIRHLVPCDGASGAAAAPPVASPDRDPPGALQPGGEDRETSILGELEQCLALIKARCRLMAEELTEMMLLADALYALAVLAVPSPGAHPSLSADPSSRGEAARTGDSQPFAGQAGGMPAPETLTRLLAHPGFQQIAGQLLTQFLKK